MKKDSLARAFNPKGFKTKMWSGLKSTDRAGQTDHSSSMTILCACVKNMISSYKIDFWIAEKMRP